MSKINFKSYGLCFVKITLPVLALIEERYGLRVRSIFNLFLHFEFNNTYAEIFLIVLITTLLAGLKMIILCP